MIAQWKSMLMGSVAAVVTTAGAVTWANLEPGQGRVIPYQGRLERNGSTVSTPHDFRFGLFTTAPNAAALDCLDDVALPDNCGAWSAQMDNIAVAQGQFAVLLGSNENLPDSVFQGADLYLAMAVRETGTGDFVLLGGMHRLAAVPFAVRSLGSKNLKVDGALIVGDGDNGDGKITGGNEAGNLHIDALSTGGDRRVYLNWLQGNGVAIGNGAGGTTVTVANNGNIETIGHLTARQNVYASGNVAATGNVTSEANMHADNLYLNQGGAIRLDGGNAYRMIITTHENGETVHLHACCDSDPERTLLLAPAGDVIGIGGHADGINYEKLQINGGGPFAGGFYEVTINGNLQVLGFMAATGGKSFRIDHPDAPDRKYLTHMAIESDDYVNLYRGTATLDAAGQAEVRMPGWYNSLNRDAAYQLTAVGAPMPNLHVATEMNAGVFRIAGGVPGKKVSWQVTGVRQDATARAHPVQVEEDKPLALRGKYLDPEAHGKPLALRENTNAMHASR